MNSRGKLPGEDTSSRLSRRNFMRAAVATGGPAALSACIDTEDEGSLNTPAGVADPTTLPDRQFAWEDTLSTDADGNVSPAKHHVFLGLTLSTEPDTASRERVETALREVERALEWGPDGVLFTLGYTPAYFDRYGDSLHDTVALPDPDPITAITAKSQVSIDTDDALLHLASDDAAAVLAVEEALFGGEESLNGRHLSETLAPVFERTTRRTGFVGSGLPADRQDGLDGIPDNRPVPDDAPFFMGFRSGFRESQATEDRVTIRNGPFAGGSTQHFETLELDLNVWFNDADHDLRVARMFSPEHAEADIGSVGEKLGGSTDVTGVADKIDQHAREKGIVGHAQKIARARDGSEPVLLRRDVNTTDDDVAGLHFVSLQREMQEFTRAREAMLGEEFHKHGLGPHQPNGILQYIRVRRWGSYLVPPRGLRSLPCPDPSV